MVNLLSLFNIGMLAYVNYSYIGYTLSSNKTFFLLLPVISLIVIILNVYSLLTMKNEKVIKTTTVLIAVLFVVTLLGTNYLYLETPVEATPLEGDNVSYTYEFFGKGKYYVSSRSVFGDTLTIRTTSSYTNYDFIKLLFAPGIIVYMFSVITYMTFNRNSTSSFSRRRGVREKLMGGTSLIFQRGGQTSSSSAATDAVMHETTAKSKMLSDEYNSNKESKE